MVTFLFCHLTPRRRRLTFVLIDSERNSSIKLGRDSYYILSHNLALGQSKRAEFCNIVVISVERMTKFNISK